MKLLWIFLVSLIGVAASAQAPKCEDSFRVFEGKFLIKEYHEAYKLMADLRKRCPKVNENLYVYGEIVLKYEIEVANLPAEKKPLIEDLAALYNEQSVNYPASNAEVKKIQLQFENKLLTDTEAYKAFDKAFAKNKSAFTDYNSLLAYYRLFFEAYKKGNGVTDDQYFEKYAEITSQVIAAQQKINKEKELLQKKQETNTLTDIEKQYIADAEPSVEGLEQVNEIIAKESRDYISCDKMDAYFEKNYEGHKEDLVWVESMVNALYAKKCYKSSVLKKGALQLDGAKPTVESVYRLGMISFRRSENEAGVKYYEAAANLEKDSAKKAKIYFDIARVAKNFDKAVTKKYILKTVELNPKSGEPYLLLAEMYSSVSPNGDCKVNDFERKVLNFLAIETVKKAEVEPKYKKAVADAEARYKKKLPTKAEAKVLGKRKGDVISFGCWINEKVTLPNL